MFFIIIIVFKIGTKENENKKNKNKEVVFLI